MPDCQRSHIDLTRYSISCMIIASFMQDHQRSHIDLTRYSISCMTPASFMQDCQRLYINLTRSQISCKISASFMPDHPRSCIDCTRCQISCIILALSCRSGKYYIRTKLLMVPCIVWPTTAKMVARSVRPCMWCSHCKAIQGPYIVFALLLMYVGTSSSIQYAMDYFVNGILVRNMVSRRFQKVWQTTYMVWQWDITIFESTSPVSTLPPTMRLLCGITGAIASHTMLNLVNLML